MSSNSNLGYGNTTPYNMSSLVNGTSSNNPANFSSNEIPGLPGLAGAKSNVDAAAGIVPGICNFGYFYFTVGNPNRIPLFKLVII